METPRPLARDVAPVQISPQEYELFREFLESACGIVLGDSKHYLVASRLVQVMRKFGIPDFGELLRRVEGRMPGLQESIIDAMTTNETQWFRDGYPFEMLTTLILPEAAKKRLPQLRLWSAACASGQEPYSISITIQEYLTAHPGALPLAIQIVGTDISPTMLRETSAARYDRMALSRGLSQERLKRFFVQRDDRWEVRPEIRSRVVVRELNLLQSFAFLGRFDVIFCRNVLIYFSSELKRDILMRMAQSLNPGGYLFLGGSETPTSYTDAFELVRAGSGVVYRRRS